MKIEYEAKRNETPWYSIFNKVTFARKLVYIDLSDSVIIVSRNDRTDSDYRHKVNVIKPHMFGSFELYVKDDTLIDFSLDHAEKDDQA